ncbi:MAG: hypothetical protein JO356_06675 [Acidobacteria bacterium]|nr:hypothetical protein [Acidobacteriota bacterium]
MKPGFPILLVMVASLSAWAAEMHAPAQVTAGTSLAIATNGSGRGTFYLIGPAKVSKRDIQMGSQISVDADELERAGRYLAILCASDGCTATNFSVIAAAPNRLSLLVHPSRVPVAMSNGITTVAFVFDNFRNLVLKSAPVEFTILPKDGSELRATRQSEHGVAWVTMTSARKEGITRIGASVGHASEVRVVQQVASDACNLRIKASRVNRELLVETDPVRDCSGNPVPDGTVVSFTMTDMGGKTTVDVPIKRGIAKITMPIKGRARISVASGVVTGNDLEVTGG